MVVFVDVVGEVCLCEVLLGQGIDIGCGLEVVVDVVCFDVDWMMVVIVGVVGLWLMFVVLEQGWVLVFVNKECLVCVGGLFMQVVVRVGIELLLVDFEYNVIYQVFDSWQKKYIDKIILIVLGGLFRSWMFE